MLNIKGIADPWQWTRSHDMGPSFAHMILIARRTCMLALKCSCCRRNGIGLAIFSLAYLVLGCPLFSAAGPVEKSEPISLYVTVMRGDKLIRGLSAQDFRLFEDGQPMQFRLEAPEKPVSIALLVEYTGSSYVYFNDIVASVQGFLKEPPMATGLRWPHSQRISTCGLISPRVEEKSKSPFPIWGDLSGMKSILMTPSTKC